MSVSFAHFILLQMLNMYAYTYAFIFAINRYKTEQLLHAHCIKLHSFSIHISTSALSVSLGLSRPSQLNYFILSFIMNSYICTNKCCMFRTLLAANHICIVTYRQNGVIFTQFDDEAYFCIITNSVLIHTHMFITYSI